MGCTEVTHASRITNFPQGYVCMCDIHDFFMWQQSVLSLETKPFPRVAQNVAEGDVHVYIHMYVCTKCYP